MAPLLKCTARIKRVDPLLVTPQSRKTSSKVISSLWPLRHRLHDNLKPNHCLLCTPRKFYTGPSAPPFVTLDCSIYSLVQNPRPPPPANRTGMAQHPALNVPDMNLTC